MKITRKGLIVFAFALVALLALRNTLSLGGSLAEDVKNMHTKAPALFSARPTSAPYPTEKTFDDVTQCTSRTLQQYQLQDAPLQPTEDGEYYGCFGGYEPAERGPKGAVKCRNKYNGKIAPPQKFKHTGGNWYGCSFNVVGDIWDCPKCEV